MASHDTLSLHVIFVLLLTTVNCQQPIVSTNTISAGGTFSVSCDASRVTSLDSRVTNITTLLISRTVAGDPNVQNLASYSSITIESINQNFTNIPSGRNWSIIFNGVNGGVNNRDRMTNVLNVYDAMCNDAGTYQCSVTYVLNQALQPPVINQQNVTAVAGISDFSLTVFPDSPGQLYGEENITFTCQFSGPETARPVWELWTINSVYEGYTLSSTLTNAVTDPPVLQSNTGGCVRYLIKSTLRIELTSNDNLNMYRCRDNNNIQSSNITISMGNQPQAPSTGDDASSADVGMIVGIVIGCIAAIAIIIIIIFVVRYRKRSRENYKGNADQPDAAIDDNLHAPPPVFYPSSKPSKGAKDEKDSKIPGMTNEALDTSYDSRESSSRGPPRYANTESEFQEPPRYEKETHRGRQNKAYDEDDKDKHESHGRRKPREREERKHRSHHDDEPPRRRTYSTDDGTDGRIDFGNPDIGTSI